MNMAQFANKVIGQPVTNWDVSDIFWQLQQKKYVPPSRPLAQLLDLREETLASSLSAISARSSTPASR